MLELFAALRTVVYMTAFLFLWGWVALSARPFDANLGIALPVWTQTLGVAVMAVGAALVLTCAGLFAVSGRGTPAPFDPPRRFVARGPYRYVRNPMYVGAFTVLLGFGLWHRSVSILLVWVAFVLVFHLFVVGFEEPDLERRFGETYREYKRTVNRWVPRKPSG